jgi:regulator of protease activity HflC (stomatin/prohibitin superfamily)
MPDLIKALIFLAILILLVIIPNIKIVKDDEAHVVERFGVFHRLLNKKGFYLIIPLLDRVVEIVLLSVQSKKFKLFNNDYDNSNHEVEVLIKFQITDVILFCYHKIDSLKAMIDEIKNHIEVNKDYSIKDFYSYLNIGLNYGIELLDIQIL